MVAQMKPNRLDRGVTFDGRFEIVRLIGEGGWARIYLAREKGHDKLVALKVPTFDRESHRYEALVGRFQREALAAARIEHANIVAIYDVGRIPGTRRPYMVMEYLDGHDLDVEVESRGALSIKRALRLLLPVVDAIGLGHSHGIVHRDLKPSNLFLRYPGTPDESLVVLDFGIARIGVGQSQLTDSGMIFGTPAYLSPEWIQSQEAGPQMDVYQLALILVEMLTGTPVVESNRPYDCLQQHVSGELALPGWLLETPLGPIIETALAVDPADRYPDATALHTALEEVASAHNLLHAQAAYSMAGASGFDPMHRSRTGLCASEVDAALEGAGWRRSGGRGLRITAEQGIDIDVDLSHLEHDVPEAGATPLQGPQSDGMRVQAIALVTALLVVAVIVTGLFATKSSGEPALAADRASSKTHIANGGDRDASGDPAPVRSPELADDTVALLSGSAASAIGIAHSIHEALVAQSPLSVPNPVPRRTRIDARHVARHLASGAAGSNARAVRDQQDKYSNKARSHRPASRRQAKSPWRSAARADNITADASDAGSPRMEILP